MINNNDLGKLIKDYYNYFIVEKDNSYDDRKKAIDIFCKEFLQHMLKSNNYKAEIKIYNLDSEKISGYIKSSKDDRKNNRIEYYINKEYILKTLGLASKDKNKAFKGLYELLNTSNHEFKHYMQERECRSYKVGESKITFSEAINYSNEIVARILDEEFYDDKKGNYYNFTVEGDARRYACIESVKQLCSNIELDEINKRFLVDKIEKSILEDNVEYNNLSSNFFNKSGKRENVSNKYVEVAIAKAPERFLKLLPVFTKEYNENGERKGISQVLAEQKNDYFKISKTADSNNKYMQDDLIVGYSKILLNILKEYSNEELYSSFHNNGLDKFKDILKSIQEGKKYELKQRNLKFNEYEYILKKYNLQKYVNTKKIKEMHNEILRKAGYITDKNISIDNSNDFQVIDEDRDFLNKIKNEIENYTDDKLDKKSIGKIKYYRNNRIMLRKRKYEELNKKNKYYKDINCIYCIKKRNNFGQKIYLEQNLRDIRLLSNEKEAKANCIIKEERIFDEKERE